MWGSVIHLLLSNRLHLREDQRKENLAVGLVPVGQGPNLFREGTVFLEICANTLTLSTQYNSGSKPASATFAVWEVIEVSVLYSSSCCPLMSWEARSITVNSLALISPSLHPQASKIAVFGLLKTSNLSYTHRYARKLLDRTTCMRIYPHGAECWT